MFCSNPLCDIDGMTENKRRTSRPIIPNISTKPDALTVIFGLHAHETAAGGLAPDTAQVLIEEMANRRCQTFSQISSNAVSRLYLVRLLQRD
jgi:hypothetical protein